MTRLPQRTPCGVAAPPKQGEKSGLRLLRLSYVFMTLHLDLLLGLDIFLQTTGTAKACAMSLQGEPPATSC